MTGVANSVHLYTTTTIFNPAASNSVDLAGHAHLTGHVAGSVKSRDEAMDVVVAKIISLLVLTVLSVLCGLLPLRLLIHTPHIFSRNKKPVESFLCGLRLFSGGIYLATCFLHLLPDTRDKMAAVMVNMGSRSTYAIPELLVISGFYAVVFVEQIIKTLYFRAESSDARRKRRPKRRKVREMYKSTLDELDGHHPEDRFELTDDYTGNMRNVHDDDRNVRGDDDNDDDDDDDDDDENNVLVEDEEYDDEFIVESDSDSDKSSQNSYTDVKKSIDDNEIESKGFQDSYRYKEVDRKMSNEFDKELPVTCSIVSVHITAPSMTSSPAIIASTITSCANKAASTTTSSPSFSSPPSSSEAFTSIPTCASKPTTQRPSESPNTSGSIVYRPTCNSKTTTPPIQTTPSSPLVKTKTTHIFPSIYHDNGCGHDDIEAYKHNETVSQNHATKTSTQFCHSRETPINASPIHSHQPYCKESSNDALDRPSYPQKPIYPRCSPSTTHKEPQFITPSIAQYPKFTEPPIQYLCDEKIRILENHTEHDNIVPPTDFADRENTKSTSNSSRDKDNDSGIFSSQRERDEKYSEERRRLMTTSSENSIDIVTECACSVQEFQVQQVVDELKHPEVSTSAHLRSIIYIMALAFHGIFEGMALGLQSMKNSVWALCFAIVVHRCVLAFKLGMDLCRGEEKQGTSFLCIGTFTLISALGIIIGILISSGASFYSDVSVPEAILQSLATGTIIYIVFLDILIKDLQGKDDLKRVSCTFVGFSLMAVVFAVASS